MSLLEIEHVAKSYGARRVLRDINLSVERGEFVSIVGCSGAGKTTLMSMLAGLIMPDSGTVSVEGKRVEGPGPDRGVVFQQYALLPWLTVFDNVALAAPGRPAWVERNLELVGLSAARRKRPRELSGGMRQRVALARALAADPEVLLLDEPLSALDALTRVTLQEEIERIFLESNKTVVMITNDISESVLLSDRIVPLGGGPPATLGDPIAVALPRPRRARQVDHDPQAQALRAQVVGQLLASRRKPGRDTTQLPDAVLSPVIG